MTSPDDPNDDAIRAELRRIGQRAGHAAPLAEPPAGLWERIEAAAGLGPEPSVTATPAASSGADATATPAPPSTAGAPSAAGAPVDLVARRARRRRPWQAWLAAAAVVVLVGGGILIAMRGGSSPGAEMANAELAPMADAGGSGSATLLRNDAGISLRVHIVGLARPDSGYYELWMTDTAKAKLMSLGPLRNDETYVVPADIDPMDMPMVTVSWEPADGNPGFSGTAMMSGELKAPA